MVKILVVDDSITGRIGIKKPLEKLNYDIVEASDGLEGISVAEENPDIGFIVSDLVMPNLNGLDMLEEIRKNKLVDSNVPIFVVSIEKVTKHIERAKSLGITAWVIKPPETESLVENIGKVLDLMKHLR